MTRPHERISRLERGLRERGSFLGIGPVAYLVDENERAVARSLEDVLEPHDPRGKGAQRFLDRLVVADVDENLVVKRNRRAVIARSEEPRSIHEHDEPDRLEGDRFPAGVRAGNDERFEISVAGQVERLDRAPRPLVREPLLEQRMARTPQGEPPVRAVLGHDAAEPPREGRPRGHKVEIEKQILVAEERVLSPQHIRRKLVEYPRYLVPFLLEHRLEPVILVHELDRFHEERRAAPARLVHDSLDPARLAARKGYDVPLAADRHELVPLPPADAIRETGH